MVASASDRPSWNQIPLALARFLSRSVQGSSSGEARSSTPFPGSELDEFVCTAAGSAARTVRQILLWLQFEGVVRPRTTCDPDSSGEMGGLQRKPKCAAVVTTSARRPNSFSFLISSISMVRNCAKLNGHSTKMRVGVSSWSDTIWRKRRRAKGCEAGTRTAAGILGPGSQATGVR